MFRSRAHFLNLISVEYFYVYLFYDYSRHLHKTETEPKLRIFTEPNRSRTVIQNIETVDHRPLRRIQIQLRVRGQTNEL